MPSFAPALETTLHKALTQASSRRHEYATLEHLLLALTDDSDASKVMIACGVDLGEIKDGQSVLTTTEWSNGAQRFVARVVGTPVQGK